VSEEIDEEVIYLRMLRGVEKAMEVAEGLMNSEDEDVKVFVLDLFLRLCDYAAVLTTSLKTADLRNPLSRRVRLERIPYSRLPTISISHEELHLHGEGEETAEEVAGGGGGDPGHEGHLHKDQEESPSDTERRGADAESGEGAPETAEMETAVEDAPSIRLCITPRRIRIDPEKKRLRYIRRLERLMRRLNDIISDPKGVEEIQLEAMRVLIRAIKVCYDIVSDVEVEMLEKEVEELKRRKERAGERVLPYEIEGEEAEAAR
jgi:hypothetical protein